jgi:hypothetical protein
MNQERQAVHAQLMEWWESKLLEKLQTWRYVDGATGAEVSFDQVREAMKQFVSSVDDWGRDEWMAKLIRDGFLALDQEVNIYDESGNGLT